MVTEYTSTPPQPRGAPVDGSTRAPRIRSRLPALMHDLIEYDLVERIAPGVWSLKGDVQALLEREAPVRTGGRSDRLFIGLRCQRCGLRDTTRLMRGERLCARCQGLDDHEP